MTSAVTEEDQENLRRQCENASLEDAEGPKRKPKAQLPPIKLGMSFSDWKQMKDAEQDNTNLKSAKIWKPPTQLRPNQNFRPSFESQPQNQFNNNQMFRTQQQNFSNFNAFPQHQNTQGRRNFFQDQVIPTPKIPPRRALPSFDEFHNDDQNWSNGPLMQPMFPPMPRMPSLNPKDTNTSGQYNNRFQGQKRPTTRMNPKSGQTSFRSKSIKQKNSPSNEPAKVNVSEENSNTAEIRTEPQVYVYRPRNANRPENFKSNWVVMPKVPPPMNANTPESREEKARLWREYRQAMKPFKNREFANAKRVIQRLGKKDANELDEKQRERLDRANELVNSHKAMLTERMMHRSARVEKQIKIGKFDFSISSTENKQNSSQNWEGNSKSIDAQNSAQSQIHTSLANSFLSAGFWQTPNAFPQSQS